MSDVIGIAAWGHYLPSLRMPRSVIADQLAWFQPALAKAAHGERRFGNWDEDANTFAVATGRAALGAGADTPSRLILISTTAPFRDRSNAGLVAEALGLPATVRTQELAGSQRGATQGLADTLAGGGSESTLIVAADRRAAQPGSADEFSFGDASAAVVVAPGPGAARYLGGYSEHQDFVDHYRSSDQTTDYRLEDRWVRDEGFLPLVARALKALSKQTGTDLAEVDHIVLPVPDRYSRKLARELGFKPDALAPNFHDSVGDTGVGHPLLMLAHVLDTAAAGARICLVGFGQGCDALLFEATGERPPHAGTPLADGLQRGRIVEDYLKLPAFSRELSLAMGIRGEADKRTAMSAYFRQRAAVNAMMGSQCEKCGAPHFPPARICVNCGAVDAMRPYGFADRNARIKSFTEDWQAATPEPPLCYGNVEFEGGGNAFLEVTDVAPGELQVGTPLAMTFRVKDYDDQRGFRRYFWKPYPVDRRG